MTLSIRTLSTLTLSIIENETRHSAKFHSAQWHIIVMLSVIILYVVMLSVTFYLLLCWMSLCWVLHFNYYYPVCHYDECRYAECHILFFIMLCVFMLNVVMLSVVMLNVVMLNVDILSVQAFNNLKKNLTGPSLTKKWLTATDTVGHHLTEVITSVKSFKGQALGLQPKRIFFFRTQRILGEMHKLTYEYLKIILRLLRQNFMKLIFDIISKCSSYNKRLIDMTRSDSWNTIFHLTNLIITTI